MHRRRWCTEGDDAPKVVMHRMWWCTAGGDAFFCIFGFFNIKYFLLDFLHFLLFWGIFFAFFCIFGFVGIFAFFCISSSLFIMWSGGLCWLLTDKRVQLFYAFPEGISSFHFSRGHPLSYQVCRQKANKAGASLMVAALVNHKSSHGAVYTMQLQMPAAIFFAVAWLHIALQLSFNPTRHTHGTKLDCSALNWTKINWNSIYVLWT